MTNGEILKNKLGLNKLSNIKISRALQSSSPIIYFVYFDTHLPYVPITINKLRRLPRTANFFHGSANFNWNAFPMTPIIPIEDWNGNIKGNVFITVDIAGNQLSDKSKIESKESVYLELFEFVTYKDLMKSQAMSDFTKKWRKDRNIKRGSESKTTKLIDAIVDKNDNSVTFQFLTEPTDPKAQDHKEVDPNTLIMKDNPSKTYQMDLKFLDFFDWLNTHPDKETITENDIKEVLDVSNIQVWSSSPAFQYQGLNYWMSQLDGSIYPTNIVPKQWNADHLHGDGNAFVGKHLGGLLNNIMFYRNQMASMLTKRLKDKGEI